jgi:eukaryotic-like serine/threonine-protein kinase
MSDELEWLRTQFPNLQDIEPLSKGGQKLVFSCVHSQYGNCVLKIVRPGEEDRFDWEIEAVTRISSEYVPKVYEIGKVSSQVGDLIWLIEQRVNGITLRQGLINGELNKGQLLHLALNLLNAVATAESVHVVHRDIKPENIIIDQKNDAWLLDFGIARILDLASKTRTDAISGPHTAGYGAPEQFRYRKRDIDGRSDLFAIGVVLYECSTGGNPFIVGARDRIDILNRVESMQLPKLKFDWDKDSRFADLISSMTQKAPFQRPRSCSEALGWIKEIIAFQGG